MKSLLVGGLVAAVVLLFPRVLALHPHRPDLHSRWRSCVRIIGLNLAGATFNLMTLGGLSLAIGILVDNSLVEIENIKRQISLGKDVRTAILDGAREVAFPEFVSTISICIVFLPIFLLTGTAADVFRPLAMAVVFAMLASYLLARTLVPTLASMILPSELRAEKKNAHHGPRGLGRIHHAIEGGLDRVMELQRSVLHVLLQRKFLILLPIGLALVLGVFAATKSGREFFPENRRRPVAPVPAHPQRHPRGGYRPGNGGNPARDSRHHSRR